MAVDLTPDTFEPHLGTEFAAQTDEEHRVAMMLRAVERHPVRAHGERPEPFSLLFAALPASAVAQRIHARPTPSGTPVSVLGYRE